MITASQIYDHVACSHRPVLDATKPKSERDETSAFIEMLWEQGVEHEASVLAGLGITADMSQVPLEQREAATLAAMARKEPLIYRGRLSAVAGGGGDPEVRKPLTGLEPATRALQKRCSTN